MTAITTALERDRAAARLRSIARRELRQFHEARVREALRALQAPAIVTVIDLPTLLRALDAAPNHEATE